MTEIGQDIPTSNDDRFFAGDTAKLNDTITKDDGSAKDITGATVNFALADYPGDEPHIEKDSSTNDVSITDGLNGEVTVTLNPSDTEDLGDADGIEYHYEIEVTDASSNVGTVTAGTFTIHADTA